MISQDALSFIRTEYPYWSRSGGRDHIWTFSQVRRKVLNYWLFGTRTNPASCFWRTVRFQACQSKL
jgi:hypothetical protein